MPPEPGSFSLRWSHACGCLARCCSVRTVVDPLCTRTLMMKTPIASVLVVLSGVCGTAFADCSTGPFLTNAQVGNLLPGRYICARTSGADAPGWNEFHTSPSGGALVEQHGGTVSDPAENVGTWASTGTGGQTGTGQVTYNYTQGGPFSYKIWNSVPQTCTGTGSNATCDPGRYTLCGATNVIVLVSTSAQLPSGGSMNSNCPAN